jgi:ABC-type bacteriocin/lantibiotic exporter with double-glycine peptidase domain
MPARLLPVTHHPQRQPADCVAACAAMVLGYLGLPQDYDQLNQLLGVDPLVGTPFSSLRRLTTLGLQVDIVSGTLAGLAEHLVLGRAPIVLLTTGDLPYWPEDTPHAVVVVGTDEAEVYVNDPAFEQAPQRASRGDFELAWLTRDQLMAVITH